MNAFKTLVSLALLVSTRLALVQAAVYVTNPVQSTTCSGGQSCSVEWVDDGQSPLLNSIGECTVGLYNGEMVLVQSLTSVNVADTPSFSFTPNPSAGPDGSYYLVFISNEIAYQGWSGTFTLTGMTGTAGGDSGSGNSTSAGSSTISGTSTFTGSSSGSVPPFTSTVNVTATTTGTDSGSGSPTSTDTTPTTTLATTPTTAPTTTPTSPITSGSSTLTTPSTVSSSTTSHSTASSTSSAPATTSSGAAVRTGTSTSLAGGLVLALAGALVF